MRIDISTDDDDEDFEGVIRRYLERRVDSIVHDYIKYSLKNVVERKLAELRLTDPACPALSDQVSDALRTAISEETQRIVPNLVRNELGAVFSEIPMKAKP